MITTVCLCLNYTVQLSSKMSTLVSIAKCNLLNNDVLLNKTQSGGVNLPKRESFFKRVIGLEISFSLLNY